MSGRALLRGVLLAAVLAVAAAAVGASLYRSGSLRFHYPGRERFPMHGIDVSHHQGGIEWPRVRAAGYEFAFIKATEGADHDDSRFAENWAGAGAAGLARGPYHFFTFCTPGLEQARHFLEATASLDPELPPVADVEFSGNCQGWTSIEAIRTELAAFLEEVERVHGRPALLYVNAPSYRRIVKGHFERNPRWVRDVVLRPGWRYGEEWTFWQFADNARLDGITGPVDLNVYCCSRKALAGL